MLQYVSVWFWWRCFHDISQTFNTWWHFCHPFIYVVCLFYSNTPNELIEFSWLVVHWDIAFDSTRLSDPAHTYRAMQPCQQVVCYPPRIGWGFRLCFFASFAHFWRVVRVEFLWRFCRILTFQMNSSVCLVLLEFFSFASYFSSPWWESCCIRRVQFIFSATNPCYQA